MCLKVSYCKAPIVGTLGSDQTFDVKGYVCRFNAEIDFDGRMLMERFLMCSNVPAMKKEFSAATSTGTNEAFEEVMKKHGTGVISQVGSEVRLILACTNL
jgi:hypothetical protein